MGQQEHKPPLNNRQSVRLPSYNYSSEGAYSVTICTQDPRPFLEMQPIRQIIEATWNALPQRFPSVKLDELIVMPDHLHFILWLYPQKTIRPKLGAIVGAYKSLTAREALEYLRSEHIPVGSQFWQRGYYEHVIRSDFELEQRRQYIRDNPVKDDLKHNRI